MFLFTTMQQESPNMESKVATMSRRFSRQSILSIASSTAAALLLSGCGMTSSSLKTTGPTGTPIPATYTGRVMGGQQPVAGVTLQLYLTGTSGYGAAATPLGASFTTTADGNFNFPSYTCPGDSRQLFLVGTGGTPIGGTANSNLALTVGLGACAAPASLPFINMNELTTVATVYALSGFMTGPTNIGAPTTNTLGLQNAFAAINKVVNISTGAASGPALPAGATLPINEINALGNVLQNCVNSAGGSASDSTDGLTNGTPCGKLFYDTNTGTAPTDTITAALNIAQNPGMNVAKINANQASSPAFSPYLSVNTPPTDWTIAITYTGGGLSSPKAIANDASGNVWITNPGDNSVTELNNTGAAVTGGNGYTGGGISNPQGIAIDASGNAWVSNAGNNTITEITSALSSPLQITGNSLSTPEGIAIDGAGNIWVANNGSNTIGAFSNTGSPLTNQPYSGGGLSSPTSIAINPK
jgi:hypothetical protein